MPPSSPHAPEGIAKTTSPSSHITTLLDTLRDLFRDATQHGFCPVAAAAYAAQQQPRHQTYRLSPNQFKMGTHVGSGPRGPLLCSCVSLANNPKKSRSHTSNQSTSCQSPNSNTFIRNTRAPYIIHRYRRKRHQSQSLHHDHATCNCCTYSSDDKDSSSSGSEAAPPTQHGPQMTDLRREMQNLDDASKMALVRDRMMSRYKRSKTVELENNVRRLFEDQYRPMSRNGAVLPPGIKPANNDQMLGCTHYARRCKLKAKCCDLFVTCRFCHDEAMSEDHEMDRFATERILCTICMTEQDVSRSCTHCGTDFAHYFCKDCRFYENTPGKKVYHCGRCHICRLGEGLDIDNFHCDNCDACVSLPSKPYHRCMSKALHSNCPVCRGYLFTSTEPVLFMRCGHTMHSKCFDDYTTGSYQCPLCMRSLTNMEKYFEQIDEVVRTEPMPEEYNNKRSVIFCSDCQSKSTVKYHFMYHKCANPDCKSYNTKVIDVFDTDSLDEDKDTYQGQQEHVPRGDFGGSRRGPGEAAASSAGLSVGESNRSSELYPSENPTSFSSLYVESGGDRTPTDDSQFTQPPIESTV